MNFKKFFLSKIFCLLFIFLIPISFFACGGDGFEEVSSVTFTTNGEVKKVYSKHGVSLKYLYAISLAEYNLVKNDIPDKYKFGIERNFSTSCIAETYNTPDNWYGLTNDDIGEDIYLVNNNIPPFEDTYSIYVFNGIYSNYISVKVVSDDTIIIREGNKETTYIVTSYSINRFAD